MQVIGSHDRNGIDSVASVFFAGSHIGITAVSSIGRDVKVASGCAAPCWIRS
jgi:hypothetical protein